MKKVILCAHRGLDDSAPDNTVAAFDGALAKGMAIALDIQRTADDHLVVVHDPTVDRTPTAPTILHYAPILGGTRLRTMPKCQINLEGGF